MEQQLPKKRKGFLERSVVTVLIGKRLMIRALLTFAYLAVFVWLVWMLFHARADEGNRDLLIVAFGTFLGVFNNVIGFWFKRDEGDEEESKVDPTD